MITKGWGLNIDGRGLLQNVSSKGDLLFHSFRSNTVLLYHKPLECFPVDLCQEDPLEQEEGDFVPGHVPSSVWLLMTSQNDLVHHVKLSGQLSFLYKYMPPFAGAFGCV